MDELRPNDQRAKNAIILIWVVLAWEIVSFISAYFQFDLLQEILNGREISDATVTANDIRVQVTYVLYVIIYIISAVMFIMWFRRAYYNLHLEVKNLSYKEGWAAGGWFVPIANLFLPYKIMKELYIETQKLRTRYQIDFNKKLVTTFMGWWWTIWIINRFFLQFLNQYARREETIHEIIYSTMGTMVSNIIGIPLALLAIKVIKDYAEAEKILFKIKTDHERRLQRTIETLHLD